MKINNPTFYHETKTIDKSRINRYDNRVNTYMYRYAWDTSRRSGRIPKSRKPQPGIKYYPRLSQLLFTEYFFLSIFSKKKKTSPTLNIFLYEAKTLALEITKTGRRRRRRHKQPKTNRFFRAIYVLYVNIPIP